MSSPAPSTPSAVPKGRRARRRRWLPYALLTLLALLIVIGFRPKAAPVETARVTRGTLQGTIDEEGRTRVRHRYVVSAPVNGQLQRIPFKAGELVEAGKTVVATLNATPPTPLDARSRLLAEARRDVAAARVDKAATAHRFALTDLERFQRLFKEGTVARQELESFEWREAAARKELTAAEGALREAEAELSEGLGGDSHAQHANDARATSAPVEVIAPHDGCILRVLEESARVVAAGTPLMEIGDPTDLEVLIEVLSSDAATLAPGAEVHLDQWGSEKPLLARVRMIEPAAFTKVSALGVEEQRVNVIADLLAPPEARPGLGDRYRVEAHIVVWKTTDTLKVPAGALFRRGTDWVVYALQNGRAQLKKVRVGRSSSTEAQVLDGLAEGEEVLLYPGDRIEEGQRVRPIRIEP